MVFPRQPVGGDVEEQRVNIVSQSALFYAASMHELHVLSSLKSNISDIKLLFGISTDAIGQCKGYRTVSTNKEAQTNLLQCTYNVQSSTDYCSIHRMMQMVLIY